MRTDKENFLTQKSAGRSASSSRTLSTTARLLNVETPDQIIPAVKQLVQREDKEGRDNRYIVSMILDSLGMRYPDDLPVLKSRIDLFKLGATG
jgi:hypothetical protein